MQGWFHGHGVFWRSDGMKYEGEFRGGRIWGLGKCVFFRTSIRSIYVDYVRRLQDQSNRTLTEVHFNKFLSQKLSERKMKCVQAYSIS